jgi:hypothetical protein
MQKESKTEKNLKLNYQFAQVTHRHKENKPFEPRGHSSPRG